MKKILVSFSVFIYACHTVTRQEIVETQKQIDSVYWHKKIDTVSVITERISYKPIHGFNAHLYVGGREIGWAYLDNDEE